MPKLIALNHAVRIATSALYDAIAKRFTPGMVVHRADSSSPLIVVEVNRFDRVKVRNERSGKEYWLHAYRLDEFNTL